MEEKQTCDCFFSDEYKDIKVVKISERSALIRLPAHGIGGYLWFARTSGEGCEVCLDSTSVSDAGVGAGGFVTFKVTRKLNVPCGAIFELRRPWEQTPIATKTVDLFT